MARRITSETGLTVITPDMRGHGPSPVRRGDVDDAEQQQRDIADLIFTLRERDVGASCSAAIRSAALWRSAMPRADKRRARTG